MNKKIDQALDIASDIASIASDLTDEVGAVRILKKVWDSITEKRLYFLFQGVAKKLEENGELEANFKQRLTDFSETEVGQDLTYSLVNKLLQCESNWCCRIIGAILGEKIITKSSLSSYERLMLNALKEMTDLEVQLLIDLVDNYSSLPLPFPEKIEIDILSGSFKTIKEDREKWFARNSVSIQDFYDAGLLAPDLEEHFYFVEHLKTLQVLTAFSRYQDGLTIGTQGLFKLTDIAIELADLAKKVR